MRSAVSYEGKVEDYDVSILLVVVWEVIVAMVVWCWYSFGCSLLEMHHIAYFSAYRITKVIAIAAQYHLSKVSL